MGRDRLSGGTKLLGRPPGSLPLKESGRKEEQKRFVRTNGRAAGEEDGLCGVIEGASCGEDQGHSSEPVRQVACRG